MLHGRRRGVFSRYTDFLGDGVWVATWRAPRWDGPGQLAVVGYYYTVRAPAFRRRIELRDRADQVLAVAHRFTLRSWTISAAGRDHVFRPAGLGSRDLRPGQVGLLDGDRVVGAIGRPEGLPLEIRAHLPTMPLVPATFAIVVALTVWEQALRARR
jgi:hypothetical protein